MTEHPMTEDSGQFAELTELLERLCDDSLSPAQMARLEELVVADQGARQLYLQYIELHGTLYWDTALGASDETPATPAGTTAANRLEGPAADDDAVGLKSLVARDTRASSPRSNRWYATTAAIALLFVCGVGLTWKNWFASPNNMAASPDGTSGVVDDSTLPAKPTGDNVGPLEPIQIAVGPKGRPGEVVTPDKTPRIARSQDDASQHPIDAPEPRAVASNDQQPTVAVSTVEFIDDQIAAGWTIAGVESSPHATDSEWIRRVYLDITGRIPSAEAVDLFLKDRRPDKRELLIDQLLDDSAYVANWTTIWTNLLIGRSDVSAEVNRPALQRFLRRSFARNRPWSEVVYDLVSAEGSSEQNGATNFLIAHLNDEAVPATAVTARLFLGMQVQCTQCHHHPFNDWKQSQFWELNSCFQQAKVVQQQVVDPRTKKTKQQTVLINEPVAGPIFYENRQSLMLAALPKFMGVSIDPAAETNRRQELARLVVDGGDSQVARAMVNRMWDHFFGYAFTRPVDDMGPHNPVTHPALLDHLTDEFVASGYDVKQLIRWICNSRPYQLSSQFGETNIADDPAAGETPLFSRMYVKSMTVEQLYDSMQVATRLDENRGSRWNEEGLERRQQWLQQFVVAYDTEENDEETTFNGSLPQALMMMNGDLVQEALSAEGDTYLKRVITSRGSETEKIRKLFLAALSRYPTPEELVTFRKLLRERTPARGGNRKQAQAEALQDLFWAFLNSSEFILVH